MVGWQGVQGIREENKKVVQMRKCDVCKSLENVEEIQKIKISYTNYKAPQHDQGETIAIDAHLDCFMAMIGRDRR